jgi:hypothetical protein
MHMYTHKHDRVHTWPCEQPNPKEYYVMWKIHSTLMRE